MAWTPPPNWPPPPSPAWSPPPGWQPDPAWGPPPPGWNFWPQGPYAAGPMYAAPPPPAATPRTRGGSAAVVVGAVLAIIGSFGTWVSIHDSLGALPTTFHGSGFDNGRDGPFVLVLAVVALALGGVRLAGLRMPKWLSWAAIADGGLLVLVCIADTIDVVHKSHTAHQISPAITGGVGSGLWLALAGAVLVLAGAVVAIDVASRAPQYPAPAFPGAPPTPPAG